MSSEPIKYIFLAFGDNVNYHNQLTYCLISALANHPVAREYSVCIVTDRPEYYQWLPKEYDVVPVDETTLKQWRGPFDFFWRIKIEAYLRAVEDFNGHCIYLDTDTIVNKPLEGLYSQLDNGNNLMHVREFSFAQPVGRTGIKMKKHGLNKQYGSFDLTTESEMWNAGVIAISALNEPRTTLLAALDACDAMSKDEMTPKLIEQFAFSIALKKGSLVEAQEWVRHYWGNKPNWNNQIASFFSRALLKQLSFEQCVSLFNDEKHDLADVVKETKLEKYRNSIKKRLKI